MSEGGGARHVLKAAGITAAFLPKCGFLTGLEVSDQGQGIAPLHRAPWIGEALHAGLPPHQAALQGDFFCAPFAAGAAADAAPLHGWPANGHWSVTSAAPDRIEATLDRPAMGARVVKTLAVRDGHPFVYQGHVLTGGAGRIGAANHAMLSLPQGGIICLSPKAAFRTPAAAPESDPSRGRSALRYPAVSTDPRAFPGASGTVDLTRYPFGPAHEDFVVTLEAPGDHLVWAAVVRPAEGDCWLSLSRADETPATMLWHSNGGRDYAPWSGRHRHCLGVEQGFHGPMLGEDDPARRDMVLGGRAVIRHVMGALRWPSGERVVAVTPGEGGVTVTGEGGAVRELPCDLGYLRDEA